VYQGIGKASFFHKKGPVELTSKKECQKLKLERHEEAMTHWKSQPQMLTEFNKLLDGMPVKPKPHYLFVTMQKGKINNQDG
jgi:hypothetical protein